jgi:3-oxoacyl-[acyl-carrier protein] reductase
LQGIRKGGIVTQNRRVFLITGASSGIGAALARRVAGTDCALLLHARQSGEALERVAAAAREAGALVTTALGDLATRDTPARLVEAAATAFGSLDVLVANAGFPIARAIDSVTDEDLDRAFRGNAMSFISLARAAQPLLASSRAGRIIAVGSFTAHVFRTDLPQFPASAASKGAVEVAAKSLALAFAPAGITVNCVVPGYITKDAGVAGNVDPAQLEAIAGRIPVGRLGRPDEVAALIAFLASADAAYITGQAMHVNGGLC